LEVGVGDHAHQRVTIKTLPSAAFEAEFFLEFLWGAASIGGRDPSSIGAAASAPRSFFQGIRAMYASRDG
jgi:hypothetical protein